MVVERERRKSSNREAWYGSRERERDKKEEDKTSKKGEIKRWGQVSSKTTATGIEFEAVVVEITELRRCCFSREKLSLSKKEKEETENQIIQTQI